jgi:protein-S-isoprenylcysteine O-methyltransferase Ste14
MQFFFVWFAISALALSLAVLKGRRPLFDAWPAYLFAFPTALHVQGLFSQLGSLSDSPHSLLMLLQQISVVAFFLLLVILFAARRRTSGPRATPLQAMVALAGTFILNAEGYLGVEPHSSTLSLALSSAALLIGTVFSIWSLATLGDCFGMFPEVRGLVQRGPYRWVRHPVYLGEIVAGSGIVFARPHFATLLLFAVFVGLQYWRTHFEEQVLVDAHAEAYTEYRRRVPRLAPLMLLRSH